jgi:hypothetical protein
MRLNLTEKAKLIKRFAPVLFLDQAKDDFPIRPEALIKRSALWSANTPYDNKMLWGQGASATRSPLVARGGIDLNSIQLFRRRSQAELWFETSGWSRDSQVEALTDNRTCNPITPDAYELEVDGPWFYAEVCDLGTIEDWFESQTVREQVGLDWAGFSEVVGQVTVISYYFLFPRRLENRELARADGSSEPSANYEGDWACFCVIAKHSDASTDIEQAEPIFTGFSKSRRGASIDFGSEFLQEYMEIYPWNQVLTASDHAGVNVSLGTHNLYPLDIQQGEAGGIRPKWFDFGSSTSEPANKLAKDAVENPAASASAAVTLAKVLAGLGIAGPFGALVGAIAAGAEAVAIHEGLDEKPKLEIEDAKPPEWPDDLEDPRDKLQSLGTSLVVLPQGQENLLPALMAGAEANASLSYWIDDSEQTVVDRTQQMFWADRLGNTVGYRGRWGVRCDDDPFNRRAGGKFPEFRLQILKQLVAII